MTDGNGSYGFTGDKVSDEADNDLATIDTGCADGTVTMDGAQFCTITCTEKKVLNCSR